MQILVTAGAGYFVSRTALARLECDNNVVVNGDLA
jgi:UDP-glucose 4-epimerase